MFKLNSKLVYWCLYLSTYLCDCAHSASQTTEMTGTAVSNGIDVIPLVVKNGAAIAINVQPKIDEQVESMAGQFDGNPIYFYKLDSEAKPQRWQGLLGINYYQKPGKYTFTIKKVGKNVSSGNVEGSFTVIDGDYKKELLQVDPKHATPNKKDLEKIKKDSAFVGFIYNHPTLKKLWTLPIVLPIQSGFTSLYGNKRLYNGQLQSYHGGLDLKAVVGTPIVAALDGRVVMVRFLFLTGNTVILDHGMGVFTVYAHMSLAKIKVGDMISKNQELGLSGATGRVSGPHLHWATVLGKNKVDPQSLMDLLK